MKYLKEKDNTWFFSSPPLLLRFLTIYVKGDMIVLLPFVVLIALVGFWSIRFMFTVYGLLYAVRSFGEMQYWFHQQFHDKKYRPDDFGFKNLSNGAIYILYQTFSLVGVVVGLGVILYLLFFAG